MHIAKLSCVAGVLAALALIVPPGGSAWARQYDCAHGPDTYRVRGVESWDVLNIRRGPSARAPIVGQIPPYGSGVHCLGPCEGNWCRISWRGIIGWCNMRYLGE